jgi:hypothetical protein
MVYDYGKPNDKLSSNASEMGGMNHPLQFQYPPERRNLRLPPPLPGFRRDTQSRLAAWNGGIMPHQQYISNILEMLFLVICFCEDLGRKQIKKLGLDRFRIAR